MGRTRSTAQVHLSKRATTSCGCTTNVAVKLPDGRHRLSIAADKFSCLECNVFERRCTKHPEEAHATPKYLDLGRGRRSSFGHCLFLVEGSHTRSAATAAAAGRDGTGTTPYCTGNTGPRPPAPGLQHGSRSLLPTRPRRGRPQLPRTGAVPLRRRTPAGRPPRRTAQHAIESNSGAARPLPILFKTRCGNDPLASRCDV